MITIIVLIILAGVSINILFNQNGIITKAKNGSEEYKIKQARETLEMELSNLLAEKYTNADYNEEEYITSRLESEGFVVEGDLVTVNGYQFSIDRTVPKVVEEIMKVTEETKKFPSIIKVEKEIGVNTLKVTIQLKENNAEQIKYSIKEEGTEQNLAEQTTTSLEYNFAEAQLGKVYIVTIEATNSFGSTKRNVRIVMQQPILVESIELNKTSIMLPTKVTETLTYKVLPENATNKKVVWSTSNKNIATVENGVISSVGAGNCIITCTSADGATSASCKVVISDATGLSTIDDVKNMKKTGKYILLNDIDFSGENWTSIYNTSSTGFSGTLDGNGYSIKNLNKPLFGRIEKAVIKNIKFENVNIEQPNEFKIGAISQLAYYGNTFENIGVTGNIKGKEYIGGLVGQIALTDSKTNIFTIKNCYVRVNITASIEYDTGGYASVASYYPMAIENCYFAGTANHMNKNYRNGPIFSEAVKTIKNSYYNKTLYTAAVRTGAGTPLTTEQFSNEANFSGWDFTNTWIIKDGYPELRIFVR